MRSRRRCSVFINVMACHVLCQPRTAPACSEMLFLPTSDVSGAEGHQVKDAEETANEPSWDVAHFKMIMRVGMRRSSCFWHSCNCCLKSGSRQGGRVSWKHNCTRWASYDGNPPGSWGVATQTFTQGMIRIVFQLKGSFCMMYLSKVSIVDIDGFSSSR